MGQNDATALPTLPLCATFPRCCTIARYPCQLHGESLPSSRCWMEQPPLQRRLQTRLPAAPCVGHRRPCSRSHRLARGCCLRAKSQPRDRDGSPAITPRSLPPVQRGGAVTPAQPLANSMPEVITAARDSSHLEYCRTPPSGRVLPCSRLPHPLWGRVITPGRLLAPTKAPLHSRAFDNSCNAWLQNGPRS